MRAFAWPPFLASLCLATTVVPSADAQSRKPQKNVELIVPSGPGSAVDGTTRELQRRLQAAGLPDVSVVNKVGGAGALAFSYLNARPGDAQTFSGSSLRGTV